MSGDQIQILVAMLAYLGLVIGIGFYFYRRSNQSSEHYFIGGRSLGPWVTAMSAEASDMSGWLLMGLPGVAYWFGLSDAIWTAIGLASGSPKAAQLLGNCRQRHHYTGIFQPEIP